MKNLKKYVIIVLIIQLITTFAYPSHAVDLQNHTPSGIKLADLEPKIDEIMDEYIGKSSPGASVAVIKNGEIILSKGYGYADIENKEKVTKNTVFEYGSVSKLFVWTSVMQLVEQDKLDLDKDIRAYLPADFYKDLKLVYPITIRHIMNHSSGFGEYPYDLITLTNEDEELSLKDAILMAHPKQYFEPGTASVYSNYATALAAYIVETVSGEEFYKYQQKNIFEPLKMKNTAGERNWKDNPDALNKKAKGYTLIDEDKFEDTGWSYVGLYPAGSVIGTAEDLALFASEFMPANQGKTKLFKSDSTITQMLSPSYEEGASGTAHGFFEFEYPEQIAYGHGGNTASFSAQFAFSPKESFGFAILTNASGEDNITMEIHDLLLGSGRIKISDSKDFIDAHKVQGTYASMRRPEGTPSEFISYLSLGKVTAIDNNNINLSMMGMSGKYTQVAPYQFFLSDSEENIFKIIMPSLTFTMDAKGNPDKILVGKGFDMSILPTNRTVPNLIGSLISLIIYIIFLIVSIIAIIRLTIKNKRNLADETRTIYKPRKILTGLGSVLAVNNLLLIVTMVTVPFINYNSIKPILILNYFLTAGILGFISLGIYKWKTISTKSEKIWFSTTIIIVVSFISLLINWKFYTIF